MSVTGRRVASTARQVEASRAEPRALPGVPVIGTGGVSTGTDAVEMLLAGATAVGVGTVSFREPGAVNRIHDEVTAWCAERGVATVAELTGGLR